MRGRGGGSESRGADLHLIYLHANFTKYLCARARGNMFMSVCMHVCMYVCVTIIYAHKFLRTYTGVLYSILRIDGEMGLLHKYTFIFTHTHTHTPHSHYQRTSFTQRVSTPDLVARDRRMRSLQRLSARWHDAVLAMVVWWWRWWSSGGVVV